MPTTANTCWVNTNTARWFPFGSSDGKPPVVCGWCHDRHPQFPCPRVTAIEYHPNGTIKRVDFR